MTANIDKERAAVKPATEGAAANPEAPLDRIWADPIGTGEPVPFDPELYEPPMSDDEIKKLLEESEQE